MEVCPLSRGAMLKALLRASQPLSDPLQEGIRLLHYPLPATPSVYLAVHLPWIEGRLRAYHVPSIYHWLG